MMRDYIRDISKSENPTKKDIICEALMQAFKTEIRGPIIREDQ